MLVRHVLDRKGHETHAIGPEATVLEALRRMAEHEIGALLVMQGDRVLGVISERDYARKVALLGRASRDTLISQIMTAPAVTVSPDDTVDACMHLVTDRHIRHLPVLEKGRVVGVLSIGDLVKAILGQQRETIEQLEAYIRS
ncbi:MAG TPA: CBS domain-containing protein [Steroidobacteraceae bacterium]|nr:CBS domain-containing protein [Steroidobacteraceae bacterium]HQW08644.1 CBS domain-containing protein [Steroidobacteraceae bacterium]HQX47655.1 CBS domain-containing protein [Steroidobacteraceae bacterium]HQX78418.1 CBS domain-containing protein [Steroidobacteraceae bacterium]HQZ80108.1 CBS domain-containing protein [Steroidobacteraceae bacterium]